MTLLFVLFISQTTKSSLTDHLQYRADSELNLIYQRLDNLLVSSKLLATKHIMINGLVDPQENNSDLIKLVANFKKGLNIHSLELVNFDGDGVFSTLEKFPDYKKSAALRNSLAYGVANVSMKKDHFTLIIPVEYYSTTLGALVVNFEVNSILSGSMNTNEGSYFRLKSADHTVLTKNHDDDIKYVSVQSSKIGDGLDLLKPLALTLELGVVEFNYMAPVRLIALSTTLLGIAFTLGSVFIALVIGNSISKPILLLRDRVSKRGEEAQCAPLGTGDELEELALMFDDRTRELRTIQDNLAHLVEQRTQKLSQSEESLKRAQGIAHLGNWEWNIKNDELKWSDEIYHIFGWSPDSFVPNYKVFMDAIHEDDRQRVQDAIDQALKSVGFEYQIEHRIVRDNGEVRYVQESGRVIRDSSSNAVMMTGIVQDITERSKAQQDLELYRLMIENSADPIFMIDNEDGFRLAYVNEAAVKHYGASREELMTWSIPDWDPHFTEADLPAHLEEIKANADSDKTLTIETQHRTKSGEIIPVELSLNLITYKGHLCHFGYIHNIIQRKETEQKLLDAKEQAENAAQLKSQFLANMSHEIRTPMNAVINLSKLALQTELTAQQRNYIEKVERSGSNLLGIINDILDFSKIEADKLTIENIPFSIEEVLRDVSDIVIHKAREKGLELLYDLSYELPENLMGDPLRISQVLINLITNAVKFTEQGEVTFAINELERRKDEIVLKFSVKDSGIGMTTEQQSRLFQAFQQADGSTTRKYGGTGLGLSISKRLIELMGGELGVESELDKGTTFFFTLKLPIVGVSNDGSIDFSSINELSVVVVDDNQAYRELMDSMLNQFGIMPKITDSAEQALKVIRQAELDGHPVELVLSDWKMSDMDGMALMRQVLSDESIIHKPKGVLVTGFATDDIHEQVQKNGFSDVLYKPFTSSTLFDLIVGIGGGRPTSREIPNEKNTQKALNKIKDAQVLVVEDNDINQLIAEEILNALGLRVTLAANGVEALEAMEKTQFELVLMDLQMPVMDGYEATHKIRENDKFNDIPIVAMTAHAMSEERDKCLAAGMNDHLAKPIEVEKLDAALIRWIKPRDRVISKSVDVLDIEGGLLDTLPGIDLKKGLKLVGGNLKLYREILKRFRMSQLNTISDVNKFIQDGNIDDAKRVFHSIVGTAGNIGALKLSHSAAKLEKSIVSNSGNIPQKDFDEFKLIIKELQESLNKICEVIADDKKENKSQQELNLMQLESIVSDIIPLLDSDISSAIDLFNNIQPQLLTTDLVDQVESLANYLSDYETDKARVILYNISAELKKRI
ncbi:MAG: response regulator [Chromatiales bacterium]|nr:response regulator [Chromatiales bacterium]